MKKHTKIYTKHFGIGEQDTVLCELNCGRIAVDIHHILPRGLGGSKDKDYIENLIALCREHHEAAHASKITKDKLKIVHELHLKSHSRWSNGYLI